MAAPALVLAEEHLVRAVPPVFLAAILLGINLCSRGLTCRGSATPRAHRRGDLGQQANPSSAHSPFRRREVVLVRENQAGQLTSESQVIPPVGDDEDGQRVIWGTNVSIADSMKRFRDFLLGFQRKYRLRADGIEVAEGEGEEFTYVEMLKMVSHPWGEANFRCDKLIYRP